MCDVPGLASTQHSPGLPMVLVSSQGQVWDQCSPWADQRAWPGHFRHHSHTRPSSSYLIHFVSTQLGPGHTGLTLLTPGSHDI